MNEPGLLTWRVRAQPLYHWAGPHLESSLCAKTDYLFQALGTLSKETHKMRMIDSWALAQAADWIVTSSLCIVSSIQFPKFYNPLTQRNPIVVIPKCIDSTEISSYNQSTYADTFKLKVFIILFCIKKKKLV